MRYGLDRANRRYSLRRNPPTPPPCLCLSGYKELVNESKLEIPEAIEPETVKNPHY